MGKKSCSAEGGLTKEGVGACSPRKFFNLGSPKCNFQRFRQDIFRKNMFSCLFYQSPVLSVIPKKKVQCLRKKKASDAIRIME